MARTTLVACRSVSLAVSLALSLAACSSGPATVFYNDVARDPAAAANGWKDIGHLTDGVPSGHWVRYRIDERGRFVVLSDVVYGPDGREAGVGVLVDPSQRVSDVMAFDAGVVNGFHRIVNGDGTVRGFGFSHGDARNGWYCDFEAGVRRFYEDGHIVRTEPLTLHIGGLIPVSSGGDERR